MCFTGSLTFNRYTWSYFKQFISFLTCTRFYYDGRSIVGYISGRDPLAGLDGVTGLFCADL